MGRVTEKKFVVKVENKEQNAALAVTIIRVCIYNAYKLITYITILRWPR